MRQSFWRMPAMRQLAATAVAPAGDLPFTHAHPRHTAGCVASYCTASVLRKFPPSMFILMQILHQRSMRARSVTAA